MKRIQSFFGGVGNINNKSHGSVVYTIIKINDIRDVLIPHFNNYPLITQKQGDFVLFKTIVELMMVKSHLSCAGLQQIVGLKASMNKGLSDELKAAFPNIIPVPRPIVQCPFMQDQYLSCMKAKGIPDPNWLAGFTDAEGCFFVTINKSDKSRLGESVGLKFLITQHRRDGEPMESLITILGCGRIEANSDGSVVNLVVTRFQDITDKIIPFFSLHARPVLVLHEGRDILFKGRKP